MKQQLIVIGSGMVGSRFVENLLKQTKQTENPYEIHIFNKEPVGGYNRIMLSHVLSGEKQIDEIMTHDEAWFEARGVFLHVGKEIVNIDTDQQQVFTADGQRHDYDKLVLATGSNPFIIPVPGYELPGVISFRDIQDVETMIDTAQRKHKAVVIGGGLLGLEAANGLMIRGMEVTVVHLMETLMEMQLDSLAGQLLKASLEAKGMKFEMPAQTAKILGETHVTGVQFADGHEIEADLVVMAVGIRPNVGIAKKIGLEVNRGIVVSDQLETSLPNIYAVGECTEHNGTVYGLVAPLYEQAEVLAKHLSGDTQAAYHGSYVSTKLKVTGISLFSAGDFHEGPDKAVITYKDLTQNVYRKVVLKDNVIQGAILYGDVTGANWIYQNLVDQADMSPYRETLIFGEGFEPNPVVLNP